MTLRRLSLVFSLSMLVTSCQSTTPPPQAAPVSVPATQPNGQTYQNQADGITFAYPAGWTSSTPQETTFKFTSADTKTGPVGLTLDVPKLPWHPPGWIPIDQVRSGYVDDAKKKMPDAQATNLPDPAIPDAKVRRVKLTGTVNGRSSVNEAVLIVHNDKVYILSIEPDAGAYPQAEKALDTAVGSFEMDQVTGSWSNV